MKTSLFSALAGLALAVSSSAAQASTWELDPDHSDVGFLVKHAMTVNVRGAFHQVVATLDYNEKDVSKSTLNATIAVASLDTHTQKRDDHLRSPDFFDAAKFPNITFKSTKISKHGKQLKVVGDLTIRDVTKSVTLTVDGPTAQVKDPFGMVRAAAAVSGKIKRKDYGLMWNKVLEAGGVLVGEDVTLDINAEFIKKEPAAAPAAPAAPKP